jgi:hypothetical protein
MGVLGLWQLLQPTSRPIKLQGLEGKVLAIDILYILIFAVFTYSLLVCLIFFSLP